MHITDKKHATLQTLTTGMQPAEQRVQERQRETEEQEETERDAWEQRVSDVQSGVYIGGLDIAYGTAYTWTSYSSYESYTEPNERALRRAARLSAESEAAVVQRKFESTFLESAISGSKHKQDRTEPQIRTLKATTVHWRFLTVCVCVCVCVFNAQCHVLGYV